MLDRKTLLIGATVIGIACLILVAMMGSVLSSVSDLKDNLKKNLEVSDGTKESMHAGMGKGGMMDRWYGNHMQLMEEIDGKSVIDVNSTHGVALLHDASSLVKPYFMGLALSHATQVRYLMLIAEAHITLVIPLLRFRSFHTLAIWSERLMITHVHGRDTIQLTRTFLLCEQITQSYCGVATMVTILNAMNLPREDRPYEDMNGMYSYFTQGNVSVLQLQPR